MTFEEIYNTFKNTRYDKCKVKYEEEDDFFLTTGFNWEVSDFGIFKNILKKEVKYINLINDYDSKEYATVEITIEKNIYKPQQFSMYLFSQVDRKNIILQLSFIDYCSISKFKSINEIITTFPPKILNATVISEKQINDYTYVSLDLTMEELTNDK